MANKVVIDVEARFIDNVTKEAEGARKKVDNLDGKKAKATLDANDNPFLKKMKNAENRANKFNNSKATAFIEAIDKASSIINKVNGAGKKLAGKTWSAIVKVKDYATAPLRKIKDALFNIKTLAATVVGGAAVGAAVVQPVGLADSIENSKIAFESKLGSAKAAEEFMEKIYKFDEKSPFDTTQIVGITQQMMNLGWTAENVLNDLGTIGDWSASLGKGTAGISSVTRALGQMRMKGKLSAEEMLQLTEAGVDAWNYLAKFLGKDITEVREMAEDGLIDVDTAIKGIMSGMGEYTGAAATQADRTVSGLKDQISSLFKTYVALPWGEGLGEGFKDAFGQIRDYIDSNKETLKAFGQQLKGVGKIISGWFADRVENAIKRLKEITGSDAFKNASLGGKIKMVWDGVIANPFSEWWSNTVIPWWDGTAVPWLTEKAKGIGETIGKGLSDGLLMLLGIDVAGAAQDGASIGGSFVQGFLDGFDGSAVTEAIATAIANVWDALPAWAKILLVGKGITSGVTGVNNVVTGAKNIYGVTKLALGSTGNAMVGGSGLLGGAASAGYALTGGAAGSALSGGAAAAIGAGSIAGGVVGAAGIIDGAVDIYKGIKAEDKKEKKDSFFKGGTKIGMVGAGAAAGAAIGSVIPVVGTAVGGLIGAGVGGIGALFGGDKAGKALSDSTDKGGALNNAWQATKGFFTETIPQAFETTKEALGTFFGETLPQKWGEFWDGVGEFFSESVMPALETAGEAISKFFTETIPEKWGEFWDGVGNFFTETVPSALATAGEAISNFFTVTIPEKWSEFWDGVAKFFYETIPYALGYVTGKIYTFYTETIPQKWNEFWDMIGTFFTETIPEWASGVWSEHIYPFFSETIPGFFGMLWDSITTFFGETLPEWAEGVWNDHIYPFFAETIPGFFAMLWSAISTFFGETLPEWAEGIWNNHIQPFFTETIPGFFSSLWSAISTFFTETIPEWAEGIWNNNIVPFFSETIPGFFSSLWSSITTFFTESLPSIGEAIWGAIKGFFTETIPGWVSSAISSVKEKFNSIKDSFLSGFKAGSGDGEGGNARGGIIHPSGSNAPGFAAGGMVRGGARLIKVAEEGTPEMIIPLGSQRRNRAMKLWMKTGQLLGVDGFARGGRTDGNEEGISLKRYSSDESARSVQVDVGGIQVQINVDATGTENIAEAIRAQAGEIAETVAGIMADALGAQFENTPLRGGVA